MKNWLIVGIVLTITIGLIIGTMLEISKYMEALEINDRDI